MNRDQLPMTIRISAHRPGIASDGCVIIILEKIRGQHERIVLSRLLLCACCNAKNGGIAFKFCSLFACNRLILQGKSWLGNRDSNQICRAGPAATSPGSHKRLVRPPPVAPSDYVVAADRF
jgi:hypothetical protein